MNNEAGLPDELKDPSTGFIMTPSWHGNKCLGNGEHEGFECCCDECDYYLECFPEYVAVHP